MYKKWPYTAHISPTKGVPDTLIHSSRAAPGGEEPTATFLERLVYFSSCDAVWHGVKVDVLLEGMYTVPCIAKKLPAIYRAGSTVPPLSTKLRSSLVRLEKPIEGMHGHCVLNSAGSLWWHIPVAHIDAVGSA